MQKALIRRIRRIMHLNEVRRQFIRELIRKLVSINMYIASVNRRNTFLIYRGNGTINDVGGPHSVYHNPLRRIKMKPHCLAKKWVTYMSMHRDAWLMQKGSGFHSIFTITPLSRTVMISCINHIHPDGTSALFRLPIRIVVSTLLYITMSHSIMTLRVQDTLKIAQY